MYFPGALVDFEKKTGDVAAGYYDHNPKLTVDGTKPGNLKSVNVAGESVCSAVNRPGKLTHSSTWAKLQGAIGLCLKIHYTINTGGDTLHTTP